MLGKMQAVSNPGSYGSCPSCLSWACVASSRDRLISVTERHLNQPPSCKFLHAWAEAIQEDALAIQSNVSKCQIVKNHHKIPFLPVLLIWINVKGHHEAGWPLTYHWCVMDGYEIATCTAPNRKAPSVSIERSSVRVTVTVNTKTAVTKPLKNFFSTPRWQQFSPIS